ncbi:hypothetical protein [Actinoplanes sp. NPDC026619]|uniref:hypothetical protein n=1 Tax=Actinoplanes sp. NPDC026619 TaxID=3155798 RepID=UPI0033E5A2B9
MTTNSRNRARDDHRALWLALITLTAVIVGAAAGLLTWAAGNRPAGAVLAGGGTFGATVLVLLTVFAFMTATGSD